MNTLQKITQTLRHVFDVITDWSLIILGIMLVFVALRNIDVPAARYIALAAGVILCAMGLWYRYRRLKKKP